MDVNGVIWLMDRIVKLWERSERNLPRSLGWRPTHKNIWQGCYDVWETEQDRIDSVNIPKWRMEEAEKNGYIFSKTIPLGKYEQVVWGLTEKGKRLYEENYGNYN